MKYIDLDQIENVQRRFTKHIYQVKDLSYEERLKTLKLPSLEYRRFRGDLIETYKKGNRFYDRTSVETLFGFEGKSRLRGHNHKITKRAFNKTQYKHFFTNRVINHWNKLPRDIVNADTINTFKNKIDKVHAVSNQIIYKLITQYQMVSNPNNQSYNMLLFITSKKLIIYIKSLYVNLWKL